MRKMWMRLLVGAAVLVGLYPLLRALPDWLRTKEQREARNRLVNSLAIIDEAAVGQPSTSFVVVCCRDYEKEADDFTRLLSWFRRWQIGRYREACAEAAPVAVIRKVVAQTDGATHEYECSDALDAAKIMSSAARARHQPLIAKLPEKCCAPPPAERDWFFNKDKCAEFKKLLTFGPQ